MQITRQADYAVRAVLYLARPGLRPRVSTAEIASEQRIPSPFLAKIVSQLLKAGLLHTYRGARGGVTLARAAHDISVLEVIEAIDGPLELNVCVAAAGACPFELDCPVRPLWCEAQEQIADKLRHTNFAQLIDTAATERESRAAALARAEITKQVSPP